MVRHRLRGSSCLSDKHHCRASEDCVGCQGLPGIQAGSKNGADIDVSVHSSSLDMSCTWGMRSVQGLFSLFLCRHDHYAAIQEAARVQFCSDTERLQAPDCLPG